MSISGFLLALSSVIGLICFAMPAGASEAEAPLFDRPGTGFSASTVGRGVLFWEQGLPDAWTHRSAGIRTTYRATPMLLRFGIGDTLELQLGGNGHVQMRIDGGGRRIRHTGGSDGLAAIKWAPRPICEEFAWAMMLTTTLPWGRAPLGGGRAHEIGTTLEWSLPRNLGLALHVSRRWGFGGGGWTLSPSLGLPLRGRWQGFVELAYGSGAAHARQAGGGLIWMASRAIQLDISLLRGLDARSPDWQGGFGISIAFDR